MKIKKLLCAALSAATAFSAISGFAMTTYDFDKGMRKGINYFNQGLYYEARDEFQWFADYNWGKMNDGQREYSLNYLTDTSKNTEKAILRNMNMKAYVQQNI